MFNDDFFELKKALEVVTLEVTDLKTKLHEKDIALQKLKSERMQLEQLLRHNNSEKLTQKNVEQDIQIRELRLEKDQISKKNNKLTVDIQSLNDRISGLVKENDQLKREAIARQMVNKTVQGVKGFMGHLKSNKAGS